VLKRAWRFEAQRALGAATVALPWYAILAGLHVWSLPHALAVGGVTLTYLTYFFFNVLHRAAQAPLTVRTASSQYALAVAHAPWQTRQRFATIARMARWALAMQVVAYGATLLVVTPWWFIMRAAVTERRLFGAIVTLPLVVRTVGGSPVTAAQALLYGAPVVAMAKLSLVD